MCSLRVLCTSGRWRRRAPSSSCRRSRRRSRRRSSPCRSRSAPDRSSRRRRSCNPSRRRTSWCRRTSGLRRRRNRRPSRCRPFCRPSRSAGPAPASCTCPSDRTHCSRSPKPACSLFRRTPSAPQRRTAQAPWVHSRRSTASRRRSTSCCRRRCRCFQPASRCRSSNTRTRHRPQQRRGRHCARSSSSFQA